MEWKKKLALLRRISYDLKLIHSQGYVHRDLHSGNVLLDDVYNGYIADLGLSISSNIALKAEANNDKIYGILPYVAPEILDGKPYTKASDIYSFGMIMWEILYGKSVSYDQNDEIKLQLQICYDDLRPSINEDSPQCYIKLMKECWEKEPDERPSAEIICETFADWQDDQEMLLELSKSDEILEKRRYTYNQTYTGAFNGGKFIPYTRSLLNNVL
ncbi:kinase-like domain-containing protein [Gigaspora rosea]|uniref:Kinase-like domain-containing protein n=1 Tax=Gigaspora rosea TaxID=44941 RepID=A0A397TSC6_9GLOM|nr:kinase-like domain-containing protein [Gigaspora rosea]